MGRREARLRRLARKLDVPITFTKKGRVWGTAYVPGRVEIEGWCEESQCAYVCGLHELGHIAHGHVEGAIALAEKYTARIVEAEAEAWAWALEHLDEPLLPETRDKIAGPHWLGSYVKNAGLITAGPIFAAISTQLGMRV